MRGVMKRHIQNWPDEKINNGEYYSANEMDVKINELEAEIENAMEVNRIVALEIAGLKARINALGWVLESEGKITKTDWSKIRGKHKQEKE